MIDSEPQSLPPPEIKPKKHLVDLLSPREINVTHPVDYLIVFGQGPVLDQTTLEKPDKNSSDITPVPISWMKTIARAAGELYLAGAVKKIVLTGGKTGGEQTQSEAGLMKQILISEYNVPEGMIIVEDAATNTLQNFAFSLNKIDEETAKKENSPSIGLLGADFHLPRIRLLAELFNVSSRQSFSAEQIFNLIADRTDDQDLKQLLRLLLNPDEDLSGEGRRIDWKTFQAMPPEEKVKQPSKSARKALTYFERQRGEEKKGIHERMLNENWFTYGLLEVPKYWLGYIGYINNPARLLGILKALHQSFPNLLQEIGIDINLSSDQITDEKFQQIRTSLIEYAEKKHSSPTEFRQYRTNGTNWPDPAKEKLEQIVDKK